MKCIWCLDDVCRGDVRQVEILNRGAVRGVYIKVCEKHMGYHKDLMILIQKGYDIENILNLPAKSWHSMVEQESKDEPT
jgi:hypothetical protein